MPSGLGGSLAFRIKLGSFGVPAAQITRAELVAQKYYQKVQRDSKLTPNPQLAAWKMRDEGNLVKADALEVKII